MSTEKMLTYMKEGHPFPWAESDVEDGMFDKIIDDKDCSLAGEVRERFVEELLTDGDGNREFMRLVEIYSETTEEYRMVIDGVLIHLCGWSLPSITKMLK